MFKGGDQGLLNSFFSNWSTSESSRRLPFIYNMTTNVSYSYAPAFKKYHENVKIVHFIGAQKPWYYSYNLDTHNIVGSGQNADTGFLSNWWSLFVADVLPSLNNETVRFSRDFSEILIFVF
jgi:glycogenin